MTQERKNAPLSTNSLAATGFDEMTYWLEVSQEKFELEKFRRAIRPTAQDREFAFVAPKEAKTSDYHVHVGWHAEKNEVTFRIEYLVKGTERVKGEHEPFAEEFMEWLGQFFTHETAQAHVHVDFEYPLESRQSKFPLPLKTALKGDAEIDGISLRLPAKPNGVSRIRLTQGKTSWFVEVIADRRITFKEYSPFAEVETFLSVLNTLLEEKKK